MNNEIILLPAALLVVLTLIAWIRMFILRIPAMQEANIDIKVVRSQKMKAMLPEKANIGAEHFVNLFEMPVLFYCLSAFLYITSTISNFYIYGCFAYVALRYLHSFIHLGYNNVMHRFVVYMLSSLILWAMWLTFTWELVNKVAQ
jgi:hypothetical protein